MARESRRKRDEKRFGRPERLIDHLLCTPAEMWRVNPALPIDQVRTCIRSIQGDLGRATIIVADNASRYFFEHPKEFWVWREDFPAAAPPFPLFYIEYQRPSRLVFGKRVETAAPSCPDFLGFLFDARDARGISIPLGKESGEYAKGLTTGIVPEARWFVSVYPLFMWEDRPSYASTLLYFSISEDGTILHAPVTIESGLNLPPDTLRAMGEELTNILMPAIFSICLMNCKNSALEVVNRNPVLNRERRAAGLKPFVRYHAIAIEPMKPSVSGDGTSEPDGTRRALHIARGHFATYTAARPLFGKYIGTFWVPSHVRGSAKQGAVISDYRVNAPAAATIAPQPPAPLAHEAAH